jgi:predicted esterase
VEVPRSPPESARAVPPLSRGLGVRYPIPAVALHVWLSLRDTTRSSTMRIFMSHNHRDKVLASHLSAQLQLAGATCGLMIGN